MFCCSAERVAKTCTKIKTVAAAVCCAKHAEIISLWRFLLRHRHYASSVQWLCSDALPFASAGNYKEESLRFVFACIWQTPFAFAANNCIKIKTALGGFAERAENVGL